MNPACRLSFDRAPTGVDDKIERAEQAALGAEQSRRLAIAIDCLGLAAGLDGDAVALDGLVQHLEQRRAVHGQSEPAAALRVVADVEHGAPASRIGAVEPVDAAARAPHFVEQAEARASTARPVGCRISPEPTGGGVSNRSKSVTRCPARCR